MIIIVLEPAQINGNGGSSRGAGWAQALLLAATPHWIEGVKEEKKERKEEEGEEMKEEELDNGYPSWLINALVLKKRTRHDSRSPQPPNNLWCSWLSS